MAKIKETDNINVDKDVWQLALSYIFGGNIITLESSLIISYKFMPQHSYHVSQKLIPN